ncbi:uncharacterized protein LOC144348068, partial [Saccoglossus kowalevskii]
KNVTFERHVFNSRTQLEGETFDNFLTDLRNKVKTCEYGPLSNSLIKDRIVQGIRSNQIIERLLRERNLDLDKAIDICRASELSKSHLETMINTGASASAVNVNRVNSLRAVRPKKSTGSKHTSNSDQHNDCGNCGMQHPAKQCLAYGKKCHGCGKMNHYQRVCRSSNRKQCSSTTKREKQVHTVEQDDEYDEIQQLEQLFIGTIQSEPMNVGDSQWNVTLPIGPKHDKISFKIDSGAQANVIPYYMFRKIRKTPPLSKANIKLSTYNGSEIKVCGKCMLQVMYKSHDYQSRIHSGQCENRSYYRCKI